VADRRLACDMNVRGFIPTQPPLRCDGVAGRWEGGHEWPQGPPQLHRPLLIHQTAQRLHQRLQVALDP
jgi:hypothetical protein